MTPARKKALLRRHGRNPARICELLIAMGLPEKEVRAKWLNGHHNARGSFWERNSNCLDLWLERAHTAYRGCMIDLHPDHGGSHANAILMNAIWRQVKHLFGKHGVRL